VTFGATEDVLYAVDPDRPVVQGPFSTGTSIFRPEADRSGLVFATNEPGKRIMSIRYNELSSASDDASPFSLTLVVTLVAALVAAIVFSVVAERRSRRTRRTDDLGSSVDRA
jgi:hypothetical protein